MVFSLEYRGPPTVMYIELIVGADSQHLPRVYNAGGKGDKRNQLPRPLQLPLLSGENLQFPFFLNPSPPPFPICAGNQTENLISGKTAALMGIYGL